MIHNFSLLLAVLVLFTPIRLNAITFEPKVESIMTIGQLSNKSLLFITKNFNSYLIDYAKKNLWTQTWPLSSNTNDSNSDRSLFNRWPFIKQFDLYGNFLEKDQIRSTVILHLNFNQNNNNNSDINNNPNDNINSDDYLAIFGHKKNLLINLNKGKIEEFSTDFYGSNNDQQFPISTMKSNIISFMKNDEKSITIINYKWNTNIVDSRINFMYCNDETIVTHNRCKSNVLLKSFPLIRYCYVNDEGFVLLFGDDEFVYRFPIFGGPITRIRLQFFLYNNEPSINIRIVMFLLILFIVIAIVELLFLCKCCYDQRRIIRQVSKHISQINSKRNIVQANRIFSSDSSSIIEPKEKSRTVTKSKKKPKEPTKPPSQKHNKKPAKILPPPPPVAKPPSPPPPSAPGMVDSFVTSNTNDNVASSTAAVGSNSSNVNEKSSTTANGKSRTLKGIQSSTVESSLKKSTLSEVSTSKKHDKDERSSSVSRKNNSSSLDDRSKKILSKKSKSPTKISKKKRK